MNAEDELISKDEVREVVFHGEIIEDYGEQFFDETEVEEIQLIIKKLEDRIEKLKVA